MWYELSDKDMGIFLSQLRTISRRHETDMKRMMILAVAVLAENGDHTLLKYLEASIKSKTRSRFDLRTVVNEPEGVNGHTALCRAAFGGSYDTMKVLLKWGASVDFKNRFGEGIWACMDSGEQHATRENPDKRETLAERFVKCRELVKHHTTRQ